MISNFDIILAEQVIAKLKQHNKKIICVESCTGGLVTAALTSISGSSSVVYGGFITYANEAKSQMAGVPIALIENHGAVSEQVARAMAEGGLANSEADIAISITGIAGPSGGTIEKPVGNVHFACSTNNSTYHLEMYFDEDLSRDEIRLASVNTALEMVLEILS